MSLNVIVQFVFMLLNVKDSHENMSLPRLSESFYHKIYILPSIIYPYIYYIILVVGWTERP